MQFYMLERGDERIDADSMIAGLVGMDPELAVTSELEEAAKWAEEDKSGKEVRIIEFRVNRLSRPIARRTKPSLQWAKRAMSEDGKAGKEDGKAGKIGKK